MAIVYHYTTVNSLLGMLSECSAKEPYIIMWATHASYLNDKTEYKYGKKVCLDTIKEIENELNIPECERLSNVYYNDDLNNGIELYDFFSSACPSTHGGIPYIISLSRSNDALPMWNTYTKKGNGISIGFDDNLLYENRCAFGEIMQCALPMLEEKYEIRECIYNTSHNKFISIKDCYAKEYLELLNSINEPITDDGINISKIKAIAFLKRFYSELAPYIKDGAYEYEQEVRFIVKDKGEIYFRESNGMIIPYVKVKIPLECIKEIIIGPTMEANRTRDSLIMLLYNKGMTNIHYDSKNIIKISTAPYR